LTESKYWVGQSVRGWSDDEVRARSEWFDTEEQKLRSPHDAAAIEAIYAIVDARVGLDEAGDADPSQAKEVIADLEVLRRDLADHAGAPAAITHHFDEFAARDMARTLRLITSAESVAHWMHGEVGADAVAMSAAEAFSAAEASSLTAAHIARLARYAKGRPAVARRVFILRKMLDTQEIAASGVRTDPAGEWSYSIDPRDWSAHERISWLRHNPGYSWEWFVKRWDEIIGWTQREAAK
jgi:hypothetical protein